MLFVAVSFMLRLTFSKTGLEIYYIIAILIGILGFTKYSFNKELGLSFDLFRNSTFYFYQIPVIILSNLLLFLIFKDTIITEAQNGKSDPLPILLLSFFFFNSIRTFGEEFIFRAFLLIKVIHHNNFIFWGLNIVQAFLFSLIHYYFVNELSGKIVFGIYVFVLSAYFGLLNRKFNSVIPSWTIHWMNGLQTLLIVIIY